MPGDGVSPSVALGFCCSACDHDRFCMLSVGRYQCHACHHQTSLMAGTIFSGTKLPFTTWFLAIYLLTQSKNAMSALELKLQLGVFYNTDWCFSHKILHVMKERDDSRLLAASSGLMRPTGVGRDTAESGDGALPERPRSWRPSLTLRRVVPCAFD